MPAERVTNRSVPKEFDSKHKITQIQGVSKHLLKSREQYSVVSPFSSVFILGSDKTLNKCSKDSFIQILQLS